MIYPIEIIREKINKEDLNKFLDKPFKEVIKFVVDIERRIIALGGELHSDANELFIKDGSNQINLWGGNLYPLKSKREDQIEYSSLINLKPAQNHFSMDIQNPEIIVKINQIINKLISL